VDVAAAKAVEHAKQSFWKLYGEQYIITANKLQEGELEGDIAVREFAAERLKTSRQAAFLEIDKIIHERLAGDKWTDEEAEKLFRTLGEEMKK